MAGGTAITAVRDSGSVDHIFYQQSNGQLSYATFDTSSEPGNSKRQSGSGIVAQNDAFAAADFGTKMAAIYVNDTPILMFQSSGTHEIIYQSVLANGVSNATAVT